MASELERAIARERRRLNADEAAARKRMRDAYAGVVQRLEREIDATLMQIEAFPDAEWRRYHEQRLRVLLSQAEAEYARFADDAVRVLQENEARAVSGGAHAAAEMTSALPQAAAVGFGANVNRPALERMVAAFAPGSPVRGVLASYGPEAAQTIERAMLDGLAAGKSPRTIKREIMGEINGAYTKARLDALTRTEFLRATRGSLFDQFDALGVERWRWSAAKSTRTCLACLGMDGKTFPMSEPFMAAHVNCRCIPSPAVDGVDYESGEDWLKRQPEDVQRAMMPSDAAFQAYRDGRVGLEDFVGERDDAVWGRSVYQRSGRDVMRNAKPAPQGFRNASSIQDAEDYARSLGITNVNYGGDLNVANRANEAFADLSRRGVKPPSTVRYEPLKGRDKNALAIADQKNDSIVLNRNLSAYWDDVEGMQKLNFEAGHLSTDSPFHIIRHEMGHIEHYRNLPASIHAEKFDRFAGSLSKGFNTPAATFTPTTPEVNMIRKEISRYGMTNRGEFVAEVYAGLLDGRTYSDTVMKFYKQLLGPGVKP